MASGTVGQTLYCSLPATPIATMCATPLCFCGTGEKWLRRGGRASGNVSSSCACALLSILNTRIWSLPASDTRNALRALSLCAHSITAVLGVDGEGDVGCMVVLDVDAHERV